MASTLPSLPSIVIESLPEISVVPTPVDPLTPSVIPPPPTLSGGWARFLEPDYYFNQTPFEHPFLWGRPLAILFTTLLIVAFALLVRALLPQLKRRMQIRVTAYWLMFFGLLGNTFLFFRWQRVPVLSMRIWLILILIGLGVWIIVRLWGMIARRRARTASMRV